MHACATPGVTYSVYMTAYDDYGNRHLNSLPTFKLGPTFAAACAALNVSDPGDGTTRASYNITGAGQYNVTVLTQTDAVVNVGVVQVSPDAMCAPCSCLRFSNTTIAGKLWRVVGCPPWRVRHAACDIRLADPGAWLAVVYYTP
jgi:hypothetical protein